MSEQYDDQIFECYDSQAVAVVEIAATNFHITLKMLESPTVKISDQEMTTLYSFGSHSLKRMFEVVFTDIDPHQLFAQWVYSEYKATILSCVKHLKKLMDISEY